MGKSSIEQYVFDQAQFKSVTYYYFEELKNASFI